MRAFTIKKTYHSAGPGIGATLERGALCILMPADNLPPESRAKLGIDYWAAPLCDGPAAGWTEKARRMVGNIGIGLAESDVQRID